MIDINHVRRIFLFAAAVYLVLAVPRLHALQPASRYRHGPSLDAMISGFKVGIARLAEAGEAPNVMFPGN